MRTVQDVMNTARVTLNDVDSIRYTDIEMAGYASDALNTVKNIRPDLFICNYRPINELTAASTLPINDQFFRPVVDYVIARCETKDDEAVLNGRVDLMAKFVSGFLG